MKNEIREKMFNAIDIPNSIDNEMRRKLKKG